MPRKHLNSPLTHEQAAATVRAVEAAVAQGAAWPPSLATGGHERSALVEAAKALGLAMPSMRHRLHRAWSVFGLAPNGTPLPERQPGKPRPAKDKAAPVAEAPRLPAHEREIIRLKDENAKLRKAAEGAHRADMGSAALAEILAGLIAEPVTPPEWLTRVAPAGSSRSPHVPLQVWSDWHLGEEVLASATRGQNEFSLAVLERRVERLLATTMMLTREHGPGQYPGIVVCLGGDFVSGALHPELKETDELRILPSILKAVDIILAGLLRYADEFGAVYCPAVAGNHGRMTPRPEFKGYEEKNADWMIYQLLARALRDRGEKRIIIDFQPGNEALFRVFSHRFMLVHGDMLGVKGGDGIIGAIGPIMRGKLKVGARMRSIGEDFDTLLMGHWHQELFLPGCMVANSLKGWDEYAMKALSAPFSLPSQPLIFLHPAHGIVSYRTIRLEPGPARERAAWVSFPQAAE